MSVRKVALYGIQRIQKKSQGSSKHQRCTGLTYMLEPGLLQPDSKWFAANEWEGSDAVMRFHSVKTGKPIGLIRSGDRGSQMRNFVGSPDRKHFVMQTDSFRLMPFGIDATNVNRLGEIAVHNNIIHIILFSPDGRMLISLDNFGCVVSDVETRKARFHIRVGDISCFCVSEDGKMFAASSGNTGNVCIWSLHDGNEVNRFRAHDGRITCLKISADGNAGLCGKDGTVKLWVIPSGDLLYGSRKAIEEVSRSGFFCAR